ncbi:DNA alkylation repair protein [Actinotalea sp. K2]|uniref:DNA alkylation repair protein n=1 Tax=Actinotalea sp. K2 TaxID=2939438 RepID=UPI002016F546|nr:DNA alkylation repair protein [Actinotalea sp. K2]MCL3862335.1 DNA alkylation repair protein [Actinotalea sp. K2]
MADFKDELSPALAQALGSELQNAWTDFPLETWSHAATSGLEVLELKARAAHLADALALCLPPTFPEAAAVLDRALESPTFTGWMIWPCGQLVAQQGIDDPDIALPLLARLTRRSSSEFPIRAFIARHPEVTFRYLHQWAAHPDEHVRRLVSEGTRPRLPWAPVLRGLITDPTPAVALLERLFDDESAYVRRSVANHLNDISKDHPDLALACAERWLAASSHGDGVVRHGLRTLIKRGDPRALALLGYGHSTTVTLVDLTVSPDVIAIGDEVTLTATLSAADDTRAAIDYLVHYQGARGPRPGKVFKLTSRHLPAGDQVTVTKRHRFDHVSIRTIRPGPHRVELQVNGRVLGSVEVMIRPR